MLAIMHSNTLTDVLGVKNAEVAFFQWATHHVSLSLVLIVGLVGGAITFKSSHLQLFGSGQRGEVLEDPHFVCVCHSVVLDSAKARRVTKDNF